MPGLLFITFLCSWFPLGVKAVLVQFCEISSKSDCHHLEIQNETETVHAVPTDSLQHLDCRRVLNLVDSFLLFFISLLLCCSIANMFVNTFITKENW